MKKIFLIILITFTFPFAVFTQGKNNRSDRREELFHKANAFYKEGNYEKALNTYLDILESGYASGDLYYNMGNTCFRLKMTGHAILYYERARLYIPRDADLDYNLRYVRKLAKDDIELPVDIISGIFFWNMHITHKELFLLFAAVNLLFWTALALRLYLKKEWTYYIFIILLVIFIIIGVSFAWKHYVTLSDERAVILPEKADVLSGPDAAETLLFQLHAGAIVCINDAEDAWKLISLPDGKRGWTKADSLEKIRQK
ncbi:MAG: hypothetical protein JXN64_09380 [Spirochaetes bacterium]|nr:hypothetical protein [Spirochaetota bacterium]